MKAKRQPSRKPKAGRGWSWWFAGDVCYFAEPTRKALMLGGKPSPEAKAIHVAIVPMTEWRRLTKRKPRGSKGTR